MIYIKHELGKDFTHGFDSVIESIINFYGVNPLRYVLSGLDLWPSFGGSNSKRTSRPYTYNILGICALEENALFEFLYRDAFISVYEREDAVKMADRLNIIDIAVCDLRTIASDDISIRNGYEAKRCSSMVKRGTEEYSFVSSKILERINLETDCDMSRVIRRMNEKIIYVPYSWLSFVETTSRESLIGAVKQGIPKRKIRLRRGK